MIRLAATGYLMKYAMNFFMRSVGFKRAKGCPEATTGNALLRDGHFFRGWRSHRINGLALDVNPHSIVGTGNIAR